jgi:hypothetical protein
VGAARIVPDLNGEEMMGMPAKKRKTVLRKPDYWVLTREEYEQAEDVREHSLALRRAEIEGIEPDQVRPTADAEAGRIVQAGAGVRRRPSIKRSSRTDDMTTTQTAVRPTGLHRPPASGFARTAGLYPAGSPWGLRTGALSPAGAPRGPGAVILLRLPSRGSACGEHRGDVLQHCPHGPTRSRR